MSYELSCRILRETEKAVQVYDYESKQEVWFPLSQVEEIHRDRDGHGYVRVTEWIARQKGYDV